MCSSFGIIKTAGTLAGWLCQHRGTRKSENRVGESNKVNMKKILLSSIEVLFFLNSLNLSAQDGTLDVSFGNNGIVKTVTTMKLFIWKFKVMVKLWLWVLYTRVLGVIILLLSDIIQTVSVIVNT